MTYSNMYWFIASASIEGTWLKLENEIENRRSVVILLTVFYLPYFLNFVLIFRKAWKYVFEQQRTTLNSDDKTANRFVIGYLYGYFLILVFNFINVSLLWLLLCWYSYYSLMFILFVYIHIKLYIFSPYFALPLVKFPSVVYR